MTTVLTPPQTSGPFFSFALLRPGLEQAVAPESPGAVTVAGRLLDRAGEPVGDGLLEFWQAEQFARVGTSPEGAFRVVVAKTSAPPLAGVGAQAPHFNVTVFARGLMRHALTRMYFPEDVGAHGADPVLQLVPEPARKTLVATSAEDGELRFDLRLGGDESTVFFELAVE